MLIPTDDSMSDDVFEESDVEKSNFINKSACGGNGHIASEALSVKTSAKALAEQHTPSPTGYPGYKPPKEALRMYAYENEYFEDSQELTQPDTVRNPVNDKDDGDGWKSYTIEEDSSFDENIIHKVCGLCIYWV